MVVPNDAQQIAACRRPVTTEVGAMDSATQYKLIQHYEAETQCHGSADPVDDPCMRDVRSELTDPLGRRTLDEERAEKPSGLWSVGRIKLLVGIDHATEHVVDVDMALSGLHHRGQTVLRPNVVAVQECKVPSAGELDTVVYRSPNTESWLRNDKWREGVLASAVGGIIGRPIVDDNRLEIGELLCRDAV